MDFSSISRMGQDLLKNAGNDTNATIASVVPKEMLDKLPPAVQKITIVQAAAAVSQQAPEIMEVISKGGKLTGADAEKLKGIVMNVFRSAGQ